jgi:hypothetical protein
MADSSLSVRDRESFLGEQTVIYLRPERWLTADFGPGVELPRMP